MSMWSQIVKKRKLSLVVGALIGAFVALAWIYLQNDIHRNALDPKLPFQVYRPPAAPNYSKAQGWHLHPAMAGYYADPRKVDVFFVHGTTFNGGRDWLGRVDSRTIDQEVHRVQLPNYAAPYAIMGNVYAPKYRQASLYTQLTLREDAREARQFAYRDVESAFRAFMAQRKGGRGFVIVGVEQGGLLSERVLRDVVAPDPELKTQMVSAYLIETLAPEQQFGSEGRLMPACLSRIQTGCVLSYLSVEANRPDKTLQRLQKAVFWDGDRLEPLDSQKAICVNPVLGVVGDHVAEAKDSLGATNATGLEWGVEPALIPRKVSARCVRGMLMVDKPGSPSFKDANTWEDRKKVNAYNLFYGDLQEDFHTRWQTFRAIQVQ
ncbi:DUF3089 domain-containing protein [Asticcacaulis sp. AC402]|uniref:DUF3089 domain-containing protein n=1 Tax=Asticcacaulis sp. AC402 TaxID=1282361 RepID=UPI0003C406C4|nr:DUF3089 domain-containing protein [Asticcacaulis sp. AC402]ESQ76237.1 hypothetical protein ABAC402_05665 [Asticcacaulis sp. AC402]